MRASSDNIRFDWAIKRLLRQKANFEILEGFISEVIGIDITIVEILESQSNQIQIESKYNSVDILSKTTNGELVLIEVQNVNEYDYFHRMNFGQARLTSEHIAIKSKYGELKKVYAINVVYFELGQGDDYFYEGKTEFKGKHTSSLLNLSLKQKTMFNLKKVSDIFAEYYIIKVNNFDDIAKDTLDEWIYFLKNNEIKTEFKAKGIQKANEALKIFKLNEQERIDYEAFVKSERITMGVLESLHYDIFYEKQQREEALKREIEERKLKEEEQRQKEEALKREIEERKLKEEALNQKEEALNQKENEKRKIINMVLKRYNKGMSVLEIAEDLEISEKEILEIIENIKS